jgi:HSP20 family protein
MPERTPPQQQTQPNQPASQTGGQSRQERGTPNLQKANQPQRGSSEIARSEAFGSPFSFMRRFLNDMDSLFGDFGFGPRMSSVLNPFYETGAGQTAWAPKADVFERNGQLVFHADLPGIKSEDVRVTLENDVLTISGERRHEHEHDAGGVYQCERSYGSFQRSFALPEGVNPDSIAASFNNGVLEVTMPMPKQAQPQGLQIPIGTKSNESKN